MLKCCDFELILVVITNSGIKCTTKYCMLVLNAVNFTVVLLLNADDLGGVRV